MKRVAVCLTLFFAGCFQDRPALEAESISEAAFCPPPPPQLSAVKITGVSTDKLEAGQVFHIYGSGFFGLPASTMAWFYSDKNQFTELGQINVHSDTDIAAIVPSNHLADGPGKVSLYYTECVDCTSQGGGPNSCHGSWVNGRTLKPDVTFVLPGSRPLPVSDLIAIPVSDTEVRLSWRDNSDNEDGFEVLQGSSIAMTTTSLGSLPPNHTSDLITGLSPNTDYCFEVRAFNGSGAVNVPSLAKECVTTLMTTIDSGTVSVHSVPGFMNTLQCTGAIQNVQLFAFQDSNFDGIVNAIGEGALNMPAPANLVINIENDPVWDIFLANRYADGANMIVFATFSCRPDVPSFVALHMFRDAKDGVNPILLTAGNFEERTGPHREHVGVVMHTEELVHAVSMVPGTNRLIGSLEGGVTFRLEVPLDGITFLAGVIVFFDFTNGVEVLRE